MPIAYVTPYRTDERHLTADRATTDCGETVGFVETVSHPAPFGQVTCELCIAKDRERREATLRASARVYQEMWPETLA
ncbi:hypothetical protein ACFY72_35935 [Streptomyces globisporus]|uniref:hypothetical protein n=1 Tax=Streptomyces globisporus TaxID=1908 RepID=UPI0036A21888